MKNLIVILLLSFSTTSCLFIAKTVYGIKNPQIEDEVSLMKYMKRKKMTSQNNYTVAYKSFNSMNAIVKNLPGVLIFDKKGNAITYRKEEQCGGVIYDFIKQLDAKMTYEHVIDTSINMETITANLHDLKGAPVSITGNNTADFYLFVYWAKYLGKLNKVNVLVSLAKENSNARIKIIKVNMDHQRYWGTSDPGKISAFEMVKKK